MGCEREAKIKGDRPPAQNTFAPPAGALRRADNDEQHGAPQRTRPAEAAIRHPLARCFEPSGGFKSGNCRSEVYRSRFTCPTREASCVNEFPPPSDEALNACRELGSANTLCQTPLPEVLSDDQCPMPEPIQFPPIADLSLDCRFFLLSRMATSKAARTI